MLTYNTKHVNHLLYAELNGIIINSKTCIRSSQIAEKGVCILCVLVYEQIVIVLFTFIQPQ